MELERQNPHWENNFFYPFQKQRFIYEKLRSSVASGLITIIFGLRRVGKSVAMKQLINEAITNGSRREDIFYFSFDEKGEDFWQVIREYESKIGRRVGKKTHLFLDEIQKVPDWKAKIKRLYDSSAPKLILSGSNSSMLRKGTESLAGRANEFLMPELGFREFLHFRNKESLLGSPMKEELELSFWEYIQRPLPELVFNTNLDPKNYVKTICKKILFEDMPSVFPIEDPFLLDKIFSLSCSNPGMLLDYTSLSSDLRRNRKTISLYVAYLNHGFLTREIFNYSNNSLTSEKRLKKLYPSLACFVDADKSKILETAVAQILKTKFFWNYKGRFEVDFVTANPLVGFEVKYKNNLASDDWKGLIKFKEVYPTAKMTLVSRSSAVNTVPFYLLEQHISI